MADQLNNEHTQLPGIAPPQAASQPVAPNTPSAALSLATATPQTGVVQEAVAVLMNTGLTPYQMASQFAQIKERYIAKTYGITID